MSNKQIKQYIQNSDCMLNPQYLQYVWEIDGLLFATLELAKEIIRLSYQGWTQLPKIEFERDDYIIYRVADGSMIEIHRKYILIQKE